MIALSDLNQREQLVKHGELALVATTQEGETEILAGGRQFASATVERADDIESITSSELIPYAHQSGYGSIEDWLGAIRNQTSSLTNTSVYLVTLEELYDTPFCPVCLRDKPCWGCPSGD